MASSNKNTNSQKLKLRVPTLLVDARTADPELLSALEPGLLELDAKVLVLGQNESQLKSIFSLEDALESADMWLCLSQNLPAEFSLIIEHQIVPIMHEKTHKNAKNWSPVKEEGNAFLFDTFNEWRIYAALIRAHENFHFIYDWKNLKANIKELV